MRMCPSVVRRAFLRLGFISSRPAKVGRGGTNGDVAQSGRATGLVAREVTGSSPVVPASSTHVTELFWLSFSLHANSNRLLIGTVRIFFGWVHPRDESIGNSRDPTTRVQVVGLGCQKLAEGRVLVCHLVQLAVVEVADIKGLVHLDAWISGTPRRVLFLAIEALEQGRARLVRLYILEVVPSDLAEKFGDDWVFVDVVDKDPEVVVRRIRDDVVEPEVRLEVA